MRAITPSGCDRLELEDGMWGGRWEDEDGVDPAKGEVREGSPAVAAEEGPAARSAAGKGTERWGGEGAASVGRRKEENEVGGDAGGGGRAMREEMVIVGGASAELSSGRRE